jgi:hypothetical protein
MSMDRLVTPGESWASQLQDAIANSDLVLVLVSSESLRSEWINSEIAIALSQAEQGRTRVVPVLLSPKVEPPFLLRHVQGITLFDPDQSRQELDRLVHSIELSPPRTGKQAARSRQAELELLKASRRALQNEMSLEAFKSTARSILITGTIGAIAFVVALGGLSLIVLSLMVPLRLDSSLVSFGVGILTTFIAFRAAAWARKRWVTPRIPDRESE